MARGRRFFFVLSVAVAVACSSPGGGPNPSRRAAPLRGGDPKAPRERYDEPLKARDFFALKRAPVGRTTVPVERYRLAREQMIRMALYSTRDGAFAPRRSGSLGAAAGTVLGTWNPLGPGNVGGRTRALVIDPGSPNTMYAGGVAGGVWKTINGGTTWTAEGDDLANMAVTTLALRPGTSATILAGTGEGFFNGDAVRGAGIFRSTDSGATWTQIEQPGDGTKSDFHYVNKIVFADASTAFAATGSGVYRSTNGGVSWNKVLNPAVGGLTGAVLAGGCLDLAVRTDQATLFASCGTFGVSSTGGPAASRVYRTTNATTGGTLNWTSYDPFLDGQNLGTATYLTEPRMGRTSLAIAPNDQDVIYAVAADNQNDALWSVYYSPDGGASWETRAPVTSLGFESALLLTNTPFAWPCSGFGAASFFNQGWYDNAVAVDPTNSNVVWVGGIDLFRSDNGGHDFGLASFWWVDAAESAYTHADQHTIVFHPNYNGTSNKQVFFGNDGGIFKTITPDGSVATGNDVCVESASGVAFESLNNGYGATQFYYGTVYPDDRQFLGGTQDNGTIYGSEVAGPNAWAEVAGGDGGAVAVDPANTDILYAEYTFGDIQKCTLGTSCTEQTFNPATTGIADSGFLFIAPFILDPTDSNFLFTGGTYLWRTQNKAANWQRASAAMAGQTSAIAVAPSNPNFALVGTRTGSIHRSSNARASGASTVWAKVQPRAGYVSSVAFDPYDPNVAYATYSTFNDATNGLPHVYKSANAGASWTDADGSGVTGIPDIPVHSIVVDPTTDDPGTPRRLYVGTDIGIFVSMDGGATWAQENTQFPNTVTEQLTVSGANLYAFTHGRGAFRVPLTSSGSQTIRLDMLQFSTTQAENVGTVAIPFKVRTSNHLNTSGAVTVDYATVAGTATSGDDFSPLATGFVIPANTVDGSTVTLTLSGLILNDPVGEPNESFSIAFTNPSAGLVLSRASHAVTITFDGDPVGVKILDLAATEGNGPGNTTATVVVQLNYPIPPLTPAVTVNYTTTDGSAMSGADYVTKAGVLSFAVGESTKTIAVPLVSDTCPEPSKAFFVDLTGVSAAGILEDNQATVSLLDNDFSGTFQLSAPRLTGSESGTKAQVTVVRTGGLAGGAANCVGFSLTTQDGTATSSAPADFTAMGPGPFFFAAGATSRVVEVPIVNDSQDEPEESFVVKLSNPIGLGAALGAQRTSVVAITDNDTAGALQFSTATATVAEGAGTATLTVTRTGGNTGPLTVDVQVAGSSTATGGGVDFTAPPQLTFNANQSSVPLVVSLTADALSEGNEVATFVLANPTLGATIGVRNTLALTITDAQPTVFFAAPTFTVNESAKSVLITVKRAGGVLTDTVQVNYATSFGSALPGVGGDYTDVSGTLVFTSNATSKTFVIPLLGDLVVDGNEFLNLTLSAPSGGTPAVQLGTQSTAVLNITENDLGGVVVFGAAAYATKEPLNTSLLPTKLSVTIKRTGGVAQDASVVLTSVNGSAAFAGSDFTAISKTVTFPAGKIAMIETVEILNDPSPEGPESFTLTLTSPNGGASLGTPATTTITIADNEPVIEWSTTTFNGKEPVGAAATAVANLTLKRTGSTVGDAFVDINVTGGSATFGNNSTFDVLWSPNPQTVLLPNGKSSVIVPITINQDSDNEGLETIVLQLENPSGAAKGLLDTTTLKITDEEPVVQFSLSVFLVNEPLGSTPGNAVITVRRTGNLNLGTNVSYATSNLSATDGQDYTETSGTLNFPSKAASQTFTVPILPDANDEVDETFRVTLSLPAGGSLGTPMQADVKIKDNDTAGKLQFQVAVASVAEEAGSVDLVVTRTSGTGAATVDYATQGGAGVGGATDGTDYATTLGTLTFAPGESSKTITILVTEDAFGEGGEYFTLTLSNPGYGATLGTATVVTVWIVDND